MPKVLRRTWARLVLHALRESGVHVPRMIVELATLGQLTSTKRVPASNQPPRQQQALAESVAAIRSRSSDFSFVRSKASRALPDITRLSALV